MYQLNASTAGKITQPTPLFARNIKKERLKSIELRNKIQLDKNTTKSTSNKNIPDINDKKQYPNNIS